MTPLPAVVGGILYTLFLEGMQEAVGDLGGLPVGRATFVSPVLANHHIVDPSFCPAAVVNHCLNCLGAASPRDSGARALRSVDSTLVSVVPGVVLVAFLFSFSLGSSFVS